MPLLLGIVVLAATAVGVGAAVLIVPRFHHTAAVHRNSPATVNNSSGTANGPSPSPTVTPSTPSAQEQAARGLSSLLAQSVTDRSSIVQAVNDVSQCGSNLSSDAQALDSAAASRQNLLGQLQNLPGRSALPAGMLSALASAWQNSMQADRDYAQWARDEQSHGCVQNDQSNPNYQAASGPDGQATTAKQSFVAQWNPIATQYNLQTYKWDQL